MAEKYSEEQLLENGKNTFHRSHRLSAISDLTLGIAHEIRNPLAILRSSIELLKNQPRDKKQLEEFAEKNLKQIDRIANVVQRVLDLSLIEKGRKEEMANLNSLLDLALQKIDLKDNITLVKEFGNLPEIYGIREDLEKAFFNLAENSLKAMPRGGTLLVATSFTDGKISIKFSDTGVGIPEKHLEKIFDPFWSTRHEAAGLGLPIAYRIIKEHSGEISVSSVEGKGTVIILSFEVPRQILQDSLRH